jgi:hypothetical protein
MTGNGLAARVAARVNDAAYAELLQASYLAYLNDAIQDLNIAGWVLPLEEATVTQAAATFEYAVPATFAYIKEIRLEDVTTASLYDQEVPYWGWMIAYTGTATPKIRLNSLWFTPVVNKKILVVGQKRPTSLTAEGTVPSGLEAYLRERATAYAAAYLAAGISDLAQQRRDIADVALKSSETMTIEKPYEFRIEPGSRPVPGR